MKANQQEEQLQGTLKKVRANYSWSLAESNRLRIAISNQQFIISHLKSKFGAGFSTSEVPSHQKATFTTPLPASESSTRKKNMRQSIQQNQDNKES